MNCKELNIQECYPCSYNCYKCYFIIDNEYIASHSAIEIKNQFMLFTQNNIDTYWFIKAIELNFPQYKDMIYKLMILQ